MERINTIGRRKESIARIYLSEGKGNININDRDYKEYFPTAYLRSVVEHPLQLIESMGKYDIKVNLQGGGIRGQAEALKLAIARALVKADPSSKDTLKANRLFTRDARAVERKKPGRPKARKKTQFSKR
ncbi:MAG: 30S ribosomal protein S9 [Bacteroidales bacterium]